MGYSLVLLRLLALVSVVSAQDSPLIQPLNYTAAGVFPASAYDSYYNNPTATSAQPQPVLYDPVLATTFPEALTNPETLPTLDTGDPHLLPAAYNSEQLLNQAIYQIQSIATNPAFGGDTCAQCIASLAVGQFLSLAAPEQGPNLLVALCELYNYSSTCYQDYGPYDLGSPITQVIANANVGGYDGQSICWNFLSLCPMPGALPLDLTGWFAKPKPDPLPPPKTPSGVRLKVLHLTDLHLDPRYANGAEANCSSYLCCRSNVHNAKSPNATVFPAPRYGAFQCDTPYDLLYAGVEAIPTLTGTDPDTNPFNFTVYTGDLVSHDDDYELSIPYTEYEEYALYDVLKRIAGNSPVYPVLGNHDTYNEAQNAVYALGPPLAEQMNWDYNHVSGLWEDYNWIPASSVTQAQTTYGAYSLTRADGLRIITLNTDFWYNANMYNYINITDVPDESGILRFITDELQDAEDAGDRVWILGHVPSGWDGTQALNNPTNLFYQIVDRYSPHVIANIFFGHTHEDQLSIFYSNNATDASVDSAQTVSWTMGSYTPLTNLNVGIRVYEVDSATFDILDAHTWYADVNSFSSLDDQTEYGPTFAYEYSTREAYGASIPWGAEDPLNATWWHLVTEAMETNSTLVQLFNTYQGKSSALTPECTGECITNKICYIRSGSSAIGLENCNSSYGSVQSAYP